MEDTLKGWFAEFHTFLNYDNPALTDKDPDKESPVDAVKAAVCQNINLFMEMNEEEFKDYLQTFVQDVWTLLVAVKQGSGQVLNNSAAPFGTSRQGVHTTHKQCMLSHCHQLYYNTDSSNLSSCLETCLSTPAHAHVLGPNTSPQTLELAECRIIWQ